MAHKTVHWGGSSEVHVWVLWVLVNEEVAHFLWWSATSTAATCRFFVVLVPAYLPLYWMFLREEIQWLGMCQCGKERKLLLCLFPQLKRLETCFCRCIFWWSLTLVLFLGLPFPHFLFPYYLATILISSVCAISWNKCFPFQ